MALPATHGREVSPKILQKNMQSPPTQECQMEHLATDLWPQFEHHNH